MPPPSHCFDLVKGFLKVGFLDAWEVGLDEPPALAAAWEVPAPALTNLNWEVVWERKGRWNCWGCATGTRTCC